MESLYSNQSPVFEGPSIFLAGPTPRTNEIKSWRVEAVKMLAQLSFSGTVLIPERHDWASAFDYIDQIEWEFTCLELATVIVFWVPRDLSFLPGFTTNVEFGRYVGSGRAVYGRPDDSPKNRYLDWLYLKETGNRPYATLEDTLGHAVALTSSA